MNKKYQLIVFDWDGTLMDSTAQIVNCMQLAISEMDATARSDADILNIIGLGLEEAIQVLYPHANHAFITKTAEVYRDYYLFKDKTLSPLFAGAEAMLNTLKAEGYDLAIATGKSRRGLDKGLNETGLQDYFPITRCADETRSKPDPQMLDEILTDYNSHHSSALMIGDSEYDLQMANNGRVASIAVTYGVHDLQRLMLQNPIDYVDNISDIANKIKDLNG